jgi:hypothetical protein
MHVRSLAIFLTAGLALGLGAAAPALGSRSGASMATAKNSNFAGYASNGGGKNLTFGLTTKFVVPKISCGSADTAITPEIAVNHSTVGLLVGCYKGKPDLFPFIELNGANKNYVGAHPRAGDKIVLHLSEGPQKASLQFADETRKIFESRKGSGQKGLGFPDIGDGAWFVSGQELGVPNFGTVHFTDCRVNGRALGSGGSASAPAVLRYERVNSHGTVQIKTGRFTAHKSAFTTFFRHS